MIENAIHITGTSQGTLTSSTQALLSAGTYDVWCDADCYIKVNKTLASDVTSGTGYLVRAGNTIPVVLKEDAYLGSSGALSYHKVG